MPLLFKLQISLQLKPSPFIKPSSTTTSTLWTIRCLLVTLEVWRFCTKMHPSLVQVGKGTGQLLMGASVPGLLPSHLFYVTDCSNDLCFIIDTSAEVSMIPPSATDKKHWRDSLTLQAVNDSPIVTYGERFLTVNVGLRWTFQWIFIVADVTTSYGMQENTRGLETMYRLPCPQPCDYSWPLPHPTHRGLHYYIAGINHLFKTWSSKSMLSDPS